MFSHAARRRRIAYGLIRCSIQIASSPNDETTKGATVPTVDDVNSDKPSVVFLCVHNSGRSQMASGWLKHLSGDRVDVFSGGSDPPPR